MQVFVEDRNARNQESGSTSLAIDEADEDKQSVEVLEAARDVGELGSLLNKISEKKAKLVELHKELAALQDAVVRTASMTDEAIAAQSAKMYGAQVFASTLPLDGWVRGCVGGWMDAWMGR